MTGQLSLFASPRAGPGPGRCYSTPGMAAAGWTSVGQFYWDARRWLAGVDLPLTAVQTEYIETGDPTGVGTPVP